MLTDILKGHLEGCAVHLVEGSQDNVRSLSRLQPPLLISATGHKNIAHNSKVFEHSVDDSESKGLYTRTTGHCLGLALSAIVSSHFPDPHVSAMTPSSLDTQNP